MQKLEIVSRSDKASWYRLTGDYQGKTQRWIASTPQTVEICNDPSLCGVTYTERMREGMSALLETAPFRPFLEGVAPSRLCIMNFLRGGLNFDLRGALYRSLGSNYHATCFMSSQRKRQEGRWTVKEDMYRKMDIPNGAILLVGDVVATGVTVANGFDVIEEYLKERGTQLSGLVFFTIGCHKMEKLLEDIHHRFSALFPGYKETHAVYLEGKFRLVDSSTNLRLSIQGTDLIRRDSVLSPEFERSQYDALHNPIERCTIYDAGSRAFDVVEYLGDVIQFWEQVRTLARRAHTLREILTERWPAADYADAELFQAAKQAQWPGLPEAFLDDLWARHKARWTDEFQTHVRTREALEDLCNERLGILRSVLADAEGSS
jgi:hypoxanthine-guanine phosphoribosyltransferase